jgi:hypothetical protein
MGERIYFGVALIVAAGRPRWGDEPRKVTPEQELAGKRTFTVVGLVLIVAGLTSIVMLFRS